MAALDVELLRHALTLASQNGYSEVELEVDGVIFGALLTAERRTKSRSSRGPADLLVDPEVPQSAIKSNLVGYYKNAKSPLVPGDKVEVGQVVATVTALGISNEIESKVSGTVTEVLVTPGDPVQFGQVLAWVEEA